MVLIHVKKFDTESLFLFETSLQLSIDDALRSIVQLYNGQLKVKRICLEVRNLMEHGVYLPPKSSDILNDEISQLKITDKSEHSSSNFIPTGGYEVNPDPNERRNGQRPNAEMRDILNHTVIEAGAKVSNENVKSSICLNQSQIDEAVAMLKDAVQLVYPMDLPDYDPIQMDFKNIENKEGIDVDEILDYNESVLWFSKKQLSSEKKLSDYFGGNEKSKVVVKLCKKSSGPPIREPILNEEECKALHSANQRRTEELINLETLRNESSSESPGSKNKLKSKMHGIGEIKWK